VNGTRVVCIAIRRIQTDTPNAERADLYFIQGRLTDADLHRIARELLVDPISEGYTLSDSTHLPAAPFIDVTLLPGVTDPAAENLLKAARWLGIETLDAAATGTRYYFNNDTITDPDSYARDQLVNPVIQRYSINTPIDPPFVPTHAVDATVERVTICDLTDDSLRALSAERRLSLDIHEMRAIQAYFQREGREPTDAEIEMLAQTWSEHCVHKTFKALIDYEDENGVHHQIDGLLNTYIRAATEKVNKPWVRSAFVDNAGIIAFDDRFDLAFKVETHNHPSALEPFGGANTGVGGVVRDILGVSARPIANTDVLCFGYEQTHPQRVPAGVLHPARIAEGVIRGIGDYGNKMGIPTVNGAIFYDDGYISNPLVFCGCVGILPRGSHVNDPKQGDHIVVLGGRTGRDGLRGATFSSMEMDVSTGDIAGSAVQIGHPIHEKQVQEVVLRARDAKLYTAITDCGAGGLSSAVGEMAAKIGAVVHLDRAPLKYVGLRPWEIWLSEAQERMVLAVPPEHWDAFKAIADGQNIDAVIIGSFEGTGRLKLLYDGAFVGDLAMEFLHDGIPRRHLKAKWTPPPAKTPERDIDSGFDFPEPKTLNVELLHLLAHPNIRSKEPVIRRYDHEVQGGTAVKPLVGDHNHGHGDAAVIAPQDAQPNTRGVAISNGICPQYGELDPYAMAWAAVDEAFRNLVAVGADPDQVALLDNFCWGNPNLPDRLGSLVRAAQGCHDAAVAYNAPFISGKDSLNNEYTDADGNKHAIPGTLLISAIGIVPDVTKTVTADLKRAGDHIYVVGNLGRDWQQHNPNPLTLMRTLHKAISSGLVAACHDCSEGGIGVALAEMCISGRIAASIDYIDQGLFTERLTTFVVEVAPEHATTFETLFADQSCIVIGVTHEGTALRLTEKPNSKQESHDATLKAMEKSWRGSEAFNQSQDKVVSHTSNANSSPIPTFKSTPRVLILHADGTNRDHDAARACELAGGAPEIVHINRIIAGERQIADYAMLILPGGFSYGDDLGAGKLWALNVQHRLGDAVLRFIESGRPVIGICNGFQALVKAGLLPDHRADQRRVTLTFNESGHFECRWVTLYPNAASPSIFTRELDEPIYCPVAHGEGRLLTADVATLDALTRDNLIALTYSADAYPANPNGSQRAIAGLCNPAGNVLGLMPHPENHIFDWQHPRYHRGERGMSGLRLFENGIRYADS
jgi:phosphoribosylformylglycinamidine synthase